MENLRFKFRYQNIFKGDQNIVAQIAQVVMVSWRILNPLAPKIWF